MNSVLRGKQTPRIGHFPEYERTTKGDLAIKFAEKLGIPLDEWQKYVLRVMLAEIRDPLDSTKRIYATQDFGLVVPRQNGKTYILKVLILASMFLFNETVVMTSQNLRNSKKVFEEVEDIILKTPELAAELTAKKDIVHLNGAQMIPLKSGASLNVIARNGKGPRGGTMDRLIMDEAFKVADEDIEALLYMLAARPNPQACWFSTPPLDAVTGEPFTRLRQRGLTKDPGVSWLEWSAPEGANLDDHQVWAEANPSYNIRLRERTVVNERANSSDAGFARERLGIWPVKYSNTVIDLNLWNVELADPNTSIVGDLSIAADATGSGSSSHCSIVAYGIRADGLGSYEIIENRRGNEWVVPRLVELNEKHKPVAIGIDPKGPIGSLLLDLRKAGIDVPEKADSPKLGDLAIPVGNDFAAACLQFADAVAQKTVRHPDDPLLNAAVVGVRTRKIGDDSWGWDRYRSDVDVSPVVAATLARWAYESRAHLVKREFDPAVWLF